MSVNKIVTKVDGVENKTIDFNDLKSGLSNGSHTITVEAFNGATLVSTQTKNITIVPVVYDADYQAVLDYATTNAIAHPDAAQKTIDNQLILDLKANSLWAKADVFINYGGTATTSFRRICWKRLLQVDLFGGLTWSLDGIEGNGTNGYVDLKFNPSVNGVNYAFNNAGIAANCKKNVLGTTSKPKTTVGAYYGVDAGYTLISSGIAAEGNVQYYNINGAIANSFTSVAHLGLNGLYQPNSTQVIGIGSTSLTISKAGISPLINLSFYMLARNTSGTASLFSDERIKQLYLGASLSETEHNALESILP